MWVVGTFSGSSAIWLMSQHPHKNHEGCYDIIQLKERDEEQQAIARTQKSNPRSRSLTLYLVVNG
jgi:predicted O-methyltransferase YrrM